ncbi:MAG TPA: DNA repair protein RecO [Terriglobales bacterium]|nr:DNA repair protein RecO [Terriglobales bacterium]
MPQKQSEAIVLRTYPLHEADLLVTFFTRSEGKVKGVAKSAKKSKKRFGGALEPLTQVRVYYDDREKRELARIDSCDVLQSPLAGAVDYPRAAALAHVAEVVDELLPDREVNDAVYRLTSSVLSNLRAGAIWMPLTYFDLWMTRLTGFLPGLHVCVQCGAALDGEKAWFHALVDGLLCVDDKRLASSELTWESRKLAAEMFRAPVDVLASDVWPKRKGADLRKFLIQIMERQLDKKLVTAHSLEKIE